jgi:hypothetical protein
MSPPDVALLSLAYAPRAPPAVKEEESNVWGDAKDNFSDDQRKQLNVAYLLAKARVKVA